MILKDENWKVKTTICWGQRDRWLSYDGVEEFCKDSKLKMVELPMVPAKCNCNPFILLKSFLICRGIKRVRVVFQAGHHVQEDSGEELGKLIVEIVGRRVQL